MVVDGVRLGDVGRFCCCSRFCGSCWGAGR